MLINKTELYFYSLIIFLMPMVIVLSGQSAVLFLALLSLIPLSKFLISPELKLSSLIKNQNSNVNYFICGSLCFLLIHILFYKYTLANFTTIIRIVVMLIGFRAIYLYLPNLSAKAKEKLRSALEYGFILAILIFIIEFNSEASIALFFSKILPIEHVKHSTKQLFVMNRGACFLTLIFWVIIAANRDNLKKYLFFALSLFPVLYYTGSQTAQLAFIVGNLFFIFNFFFLKFSKKYFFSLFVAVNIIMLTTMYLLQPVTVAKETQMPFSFAHRLCIWKYTATLVTENPLGYGLDVSHTQRFSSMDDKELCIPKDSYGPIYMDIMYHISHHPHYQLLQIIFELGIIAGFLFFLGCYLSLKQIWQLPNAFHQNTALSLFLAIFIIGLTGFGIWQNWLIASYLLAISLAKSFMSERKS